MKSRLAVFLFLISLSCHAKKFVYPIEIVAGMADLIVIGEIEQMDSNSYVFKINQTIKGEASQRITVHMFKEWTCDRRIRKPEIGQKLFLFLNKKILFYEIINGSTGEFFIEEDQIVGDINGARPLVIELSDALQIFLSCYTLKEYEAYAAKGTIFIQNKSDSEVRKLYSTSILTKYFFDRMGK